MIGLNASLYYIAKLSKTMKWLKIKMPLSCQNCPVIDGRLTVECPLIWPIRKDVKNLKND